jgi:hypothetical protein
MVEVAQRNARGLGFEVEGRVADAVTLLAARRIGAVIVAAASPNLPSPPASTASSVSSTVAAAAWGSGQVQGSGVDAAGATMSMVTLSRAASPS